MMAVEPMDGQAGLSRIEADWWALRRADPRATPFQSPAWLLSWAAVFQPERCLALFQRDGGRLLALLPLFTLTEAGRTRLLPLGAGPTDWLDGLLHPDAPAGAPARLLEAADGVAGWSELELCQLTADSPFATAPAPWPECRQEGEPCPVVPALPPTLSRAFAQNLRTARNRLDRRGGWRVRRITGPELPAAFDRLADLHGARWRSRGEAG